MTAPRPRPTTTTAFRADPGRRRSRTIIDCGTGSASAKANLVNLGGGRYGLTATVINESTKAIELDGLVVTADYGAAGQEAVHRVGRGPAYRGPARPGRGDLLDPRIRGQRPPSNFVISDFRFHTAGLPECTSH